MPPIPQSPQPVLPEAPQKPYGVFSLLAVIVMVTMVSIGSFLIVGTTPAEFVPGTVVVIPKGSNTKEAAALLESAHIIRSASVLEFILGTIYHGAPIIAGDFQFDKKTDVLGVADRLTGGTFGAGAAKIIIPEGSSVADIARTLSTKIPTFNTDEFVARAKPLEGFLFPATYPVFKTTEPSVFVKTLQSEYEKRVTPLRPEIKTSGHTEKQIIIMASILEKEARNAEEAKTISGILWKRIKNGQALQVDAPFLYVLNKTSAQLTVTDLKKDGPYNTYTRPGLPAGPIGNPGLAMIDAAIHPIASSYNFYLHGIDGQIHYAKTYAEHLANKAKYLK